MFKILLLGFDFSTNQSINEQSFIFWSKLKASMIESLECGESHNENASGLIKSLSLVHWDFDAS